MKKDLSPNICKFHPGVMIILEPDDDLKWRQGLYNRNIFVK